MGINATLRNSKPTSPTSECKLKEDNRRLMEIVLNQSLELCELKNIGLVKLRREGRQAMDYIIENLAFIAKQRDLGRPLSVILRPLEISRSTSDGWKKRFDGKPKDKPATKPHPLQLTPGENAMIVETKEENLTCRHRQIQRILQNRGVYISQSSVFKDLKENDLVETFERREAPWKEPRYEVRAKCLEWGSDWTKIKVGHKTWHLLTVIDFFSRYLIAFEIVPSVNASHIKAIYERALRVENLTKGLKPKLRVDQGSPYTSLVTKEFFKMMGSELSWARVRRPTDNAITEHFYGTIRQEETYVVGNYPDLGSAKEEIGKFIDYYNNLQHHQALWNFVPAHVHKVNNKS